MHSVSIKVSLGCVCLFERVARLSALTPLTAFAIMPPVPETMREQMAGMPRQMPHKAVPDGAGLGFICLIKGYGEIAHFGDSKKQPNFCVGAYPSCLTSYFQTNSPFDLLMFRPENWDGLHKISWKGGEDGLDGQCTYYARWYCFGFSERSMRPFFPSCLAFTATVNICLEYSFS